MKGMLRNNVKYLLRKIKELYEDDDNKEKIEEWIDGITIDKDDGGFMSAKIDEEGNVEFYDEETEKKIEIEEMSESELFDVQVALEELVEEIE